MSGTPYTLNETELAACNPLPGKGGEALRAFCPFHGSDHQRSLRVTLATGRFLCFACGAWGYLTEAQKRWQEERQQTHVRQPPPYQKIRPSQVKQPSVSGTSFPSPPRSLVPDLLPQLLAFQAALPGSLGEAYLQKRHISLQVAQEHGVGYAAPGTWPHHVRDWQQGRIVIPHTMPDGNLVNLYGRAVELTTNAPKALRHDHLPGDKGYYNAKVLHDTQGPLWICEGPFDALSLHAAGITRVIALFGVYGWRWEWVREVKELVFALDTDTPGQKQWRLLAQQAVLRGKYVAFLPLEAYGGEKDVNAAWIAGTLQLHNPSITKEVSILEPSRYEHWEERSAIMEWEGGLSRFDAERDALQSIHPNSII